MGLSIGVLKETVPGERRVAITPKVMDLLNKVGASVSIETGAGLESGFSDEDYAAKGARIDPNAAAVVADAQILLTVRAPEPVDFVRKRQIVIGFCDPLSEPQLAAAYAQAGATLFSMELVPRITRAQSMDALSSMASMAGYKAVLIAASTLAAPVSHDDHGGRHGGPGARAGDRCGRGGPASDRDRAAAGRGGQRLRCALRRQGTDREPGREVREYRHRRRRREGRAVTRAP